MNSSVLSRTRPTPTQAASSRRSPSAGLTGANRSARSGDWASKRSCRRKDSSRAAASRGAGRRAKASRNMRSRRLRQGAGASLTTRRAKACAASTNTSSLSRFSACSGVFERRRRLAVRFAPGASKVISCGYGAVRWKNVYSPRRKRSGALAVAPPVGVPAVGQIGHALGLRRVHAGPADGWGEEAAHAQRGIPQSLGGQTQAVLAGKPSVVGVPVGEFGGGRPTIAGRQRTSRSACACA